MGRGNFGGGPQMGGGNFGAFRGAPGGGFRGEFRGAPFREHGPAVARRHFRGPIVGFGAPYYSDYGYSTYDDGCYELHQVWTGYRWRYVREWVCD